MDIFAEDVNYWQTGRSSPDIWIDKAKKQIEKIGGNVLMEGFGSEPTSGRSAYMIAFEIGGDNFKVVWPVLQSKSKNEKSARIQAATMLYHDVKAKCITSYVLGPRAAFFTFLLLPDGKTAAEASTPELAEVLPVLFGGNAKLLSNGETIEGEYKFE